MRSEKGRKDPLSVSLPPPHIPFRSLPNIHLALAQGEFLEILIPEPLATVPWDGWPMNTSDFAGSS